MFGKTLKPPTAEEMRNSAAFRDVFYPRNRGRYVFRVQTAIPEVHVKTVWFEQDPTSKRWVTKRIHGREGRAAGVCGDRCGSRPSQRLVIVGGRRTQVAA
ncbi:MAG: hypothetical protein KatS3mg054_0181 [Chloroflexus sp.]|nr:MAG: hypothetical protein KatS3mg054_0181 [Chloroflexus sp.]